MPPAGSVENNATVSAQVEGSDASAEQETSKAWMVAFQEWMNIKIKGMPTANPPIEGWGASFVSDHWHR